MWCLYGICNLVIRIDGIWDPEKWHRSLGGGSGGGSSRGPSPLTGTELRERRIEITRRHSSKCMHINL